MFSAGTHRADSVGPSLQPRSVYTAQKCNMIISEGRVLVQGTGASMVLRVSGAMRRRQGQKKKALR